LAGEVGEDCDLVINCALTMVAGFGHVLLAAQWHGLYGGDVNSRRHDLPVGSIERLRVEY